MADTLDVIPVGRWRIGFDRQTKQTVLIFEFSDRAPLAFAAAPDEAAKIGRALCELDTAGVPTPARLS